MSTGTDALTIDMLERLSAHLNDVWNQGNHFETLSPELNTYHCGLDSGPSWGLRFGTYWNHFMLLGGLNSETAHKMQAQTDLEKEAGNIISVLACIYSTDNTDHARSRVKSLEDAHEASKSYPGEETIKPVMAINTFWLTPMGHALKDTDTGLQKWRAGDEHGREVAITAAKQAVQNIIWSVQFVTSKLN